MKSLLSFAAAGLVVLAGGTAQAQHFHGHAHYHHGHAHYHGHWHYPSYGSYGSGYAYPYTYGSVWSPPTYSYPAVATSPPVVTYSAPAVVPASSTSLKPNVLPPYAGPGVSLRLPAEFPNPLYVRIDGRDIELMPGTEVVLKDKGSCLVEFDRGGDFGAARTEMTEGRYKFGVGARGWYTEPDSPGGLRPNPLPGESKK